MLVVKFEMYPGGDEKRRHEIGRIELSNLSNLANFSDYDVYAYLEKQVHCRFRLNGHERARGAFALVHRALTEALKRSKK